MHRLRIDPSFRWSVEGTDELAFAKKSDAICDLTGAIDIMSHHQDRSIVVR